MTYDQVMMQLAAMVQKFGLAQSGIAGCQHSLGMWNKSLPDIVMTIPDMGFCHTSINDIYTHWCENGVTLGDDQPFMKERTRGQEFNCYFMEIDLDDRVSRSIMKSAFPHLFEFYERFPALKGEGKHRVVHFILPNKYNQLPFDANYDFDSLPQALIGSALDLVALEKFIALR
ncbi:hypothetical protein OTK49_02285 [Vibrio coralliirubri]|uniref:hypothetical protein n=1 Tax=Vibrio coralliirubri TaxID=1516159 RepID=UPI002283447F|nr:hypothetical protein [Vibrio coralliirubri]MCY9861344.1 hypothetical protein [Vibrio coralliirubri]